MSTHMKIEALNQKFARDGIVRFESGRGGLVRTVITTPHATAHVYLHGGHVTHYQPAGQPDLLFVSDKSWFEADKPIRGGIPICFPWFGNAGDPAHGFARLVEWRVHEVAVTPEHEAVLTLELPTPKLASGSSSWSLEARVRFQVRVGAHLKLALEVMNTGNKPLTFEEALHTYFAVADIKRVSVQGLHGAEYLDKTLDFARKTQQADPLTFTAETDRVYFNTRATCHIHDPQSHPARRITVAKQGSDDTVVWNPWSDRAKTMPDYGDDEWHKMLCIETANVRDHAIQLKPGETHTMRAELSCEVV